MAHIQLEDVTVILHSWQGGQVLEVVALDQVSLRVRHGEVMGVIGPTGCGKTTLLRVVAGLVQPVSGQVLIDGKDQRDVAPRHRGLGMVFQDYALYPHFDVWDNLAFYFKLRKREAEVPQKVRDAAEIVGVDLQVLLRRKPPQLSIGQRQQVAVARCLVRDPRIFLMDEPFANLDAVQRARARLQVKRLLQRFRVTTLHVTHDQHEAAALCDRIAVMDAGQILQVDTYLHLLEWPDNLRVAEFVSEPGTQFVEGTLVEGRFACSAFSVPLLPYILARAEAGQRLVAEIRPLAVSLAEDVTQALKARVEWIQPLPLQRAQRVTCRVADQLLTLELPRRVPIRVGEHLPLCIDGERVQVFDALSGVNLALRAPPAQGRVHAAAMSWRSQG